jgi:hypothetical protein
MLMRLFHKSIVPLIIAIITLCASNIQWGRESWKDIIEADGKGYYAYLPAAFIYHDLSFSFFDSIEKKYPNPHIYYDYRMNAEGGAVNKYYSGTALAMAPFFLVAHAVAKITGADPDGYSKIYPLMINVAAIFYLLAALLFLRRLLRSFGIKERISSFILVAIVFGTNVFYYTVCEPAMSHIYSFAFITAFVYFTREFFLSQERKTLFILSFLLGMIVLIRPVNGLIVLLIPFSGGNTGLKSAWNWLLRNKAAGFISAIIVLSVISIQLIIYRIQTGHFFVYAYGAETFNWSDPHPLDFLVSYKKGLFLYTPLVLLSASGLFVLFKNDKFRFWSLLLFLLILLYVLSSWWNWWYGGSFSSRVSLDYFSIPALLLGLFCKELKTKISKGILSALVIGCIVLCQVQTFQYRYYLIHWEKMDREHYWRVFMKLDKIGKENPNADLLEEKAL